PIFMGGGSEVAARRAARYADHFIPTLPEFHALYRVERASPGKRTPCPPSRTADNFLYVAEDPDAAWQRIAPYAIHEMNAYGRWIFEAGTRGPYRPGDEPRAVGR